MVGIAEPLDFQRLRVVGVVAFDAFRGTADLARFADEPPGAHGLVQDTAGPRLFVRHRPRPLAISSATLLEVALAIPQSAATRTQLSREALLVAAV